MRRLDEIANNTPGVNHTVAIAGQSILLNANAPNFGAMYVMLDDFTTGSLPDSAAKRSPRSCRSQFQRRDRRGMVNVFSAPPVDGLGTAGGFKIMIEDRGDRGSILCKRWPTTSRSPAQTNPNLRDTFTSFRANTPWLYLDIDRTAAKVMGVSMGEVFNTLQVYSARCTSTISTSSAAPGRSTCRRTSATARKSKISSS